MSRSVIVAPVEQVTDIVRIVRVATAIAVALVDVHLVRVETDRGRSGSQWPGRSAWSPENEARMATLVLVSPAHGPALDRVARGEIGHVIVAVATSSDADLVVMGVAPRTALDRLLFGATLGAVLRRSSAPVLAVPVTGGTEEWDERTVREDLCAALAEPALAARCVA
jgi:nucleotide-binding universal stress UspA family protein